MCTGGGVEVGSGPTQEGKRSEKVEGRGIGAGVRGAGREGQGEPYAHAGGESREIKTGGTNDAMKIEEETLEEMTPVPSGGKKSSTVED